MEHVRTQKRRRRATVRAPAAGRSALPPTAHSPGGSGAGLVSQQFRYTPTHHAQFTQHGFVTFPSFLDPECLPALRAQVNQVYNAAAVRGQLDGEWIEQLHQSLPKEHNWVWDIATHPRVIAAMVRHLGPDLVL